MASYTFYDLQGDANGVVDDTRGRTFTFSMTSEESAGFCVVAKVSGASAGLGATPATGILYQSWDNGTTWEQIPSATSMSINAAGIFKAYPTAGSDPIAPLLKIELAPCGAGLSYTLVFIKRTHFTGGMTFKSAGSSGSLIQMKYGAGGVYADSYVIYDTTTPANTRALPTLGLFNYGPGGVFALTVPTYDTTTPGNTRGFPTLGLFNYGSGGTFALTLPTFDTTVPSNTRPIPTVDVPPSTRISVRNAYGTTPVTTLAWVALGITATGREKVWRIFDSSGETLELGVGAPGAEVSSLLIPPGGIDFDSAINGFTGGALSVKAVSGNATVGELVLQAWG